MINDGSADEAASSPAHELGSRDHRRLGAVLDLFSFHDVSPGAVFWHPAGQALWRALEGAMRELQARRGYAEISSPILVSRRLWERSGHWDLYRDHLFLFGPPGAELSLKPMNCPESALIYNGKVRSWRDLPLRYAEYGRVHRDELSGVLSGLLRLRAFVQDDAHIYLRPDQLEAEIIALLGEVKEAYGWFGLAPRFAFADKPAKALGDPALWAQAEAALEAALAASGVVYELRPGDGAFYAPKIDVYIDDALGRAWQMASIQVDLVMLPERFDLAYSDRSGHQARPIVIHRAIYGSFERFIGIILEHFAGALPFWCAPLQALIVPIADRHLEAGAELLAILRARGLRAEIAAGPERMAHKIAVAAEQRLPLVLIIGDREAAAGSASLRWRGGLQEPAEPFVALADRLAAKAAARASS
jgi:threonyl-tRNA synthetase